MPTKQWSTERWIKEIENNYSAVFETALMVSERDREESPLSTSEKNMMEAWQIVAERPNPYSRKIL